MSTLRISNIEAKADNSSPTVDEQLKITNSTGDVMLHLDGRTSGITTVGINTTAQTIKFDENNNVYITGIVTATELHGTVAVGTSITYGDNEKAYFGADLDLEIYHGSGHSRIVNNLNSGALKLQSNQIEMVNKANSETLAQFFDGGACSLRFNNSTKFSTTASGVDCPDQLQVDGTTFATGGLKINADNQKLRIGAGDDLEIWHQSSDESAVIKNVNDTGWLRLLSGDSNSSGILLKNRDDDVTYLRAKNEQGVELFNSNSVKFETTSTGATITSDLILNHASGDKAIRWATGGTNKWSLYHNNGAGALCAFDNANNAERLRIDSSGSLLIGGTSSSGATEKLRIENDSATSDVCQVTIISGNAERAILNFGDAQDHNIGRLTYENTDNHMSLWTNNTERLRITSSGALLVGTTTPTYNSGDMQHEIKKNNNRTYSAPNMTSHAHLLLNNSDTTTNAFCGLGFRAGTGDGSIGFVFTGSANAADFVINTDGGSNGIERLRVESGGNVRIGALNSGRLIIGHTANRSVAGGFASLQVQKNSSEAAHFIRTSNDNGAPILALAKSRSSSGAVCQAGDKIGVLGWYPHDGTDCNHAAAEIHAEVVSGIGANDVPGDLVFKTNGGTTTTTERLRISSGGGVLIGSGNQTKATDGVMIERNTVDGYAHITAGRSGGNFSGMSFFASGGDGVTKRLQIGHDGPFKFFTQNGTTERLRIGATGEIGVAGAGSINFGSVGQVLRSGGNSAGCKWVDQGISDVDMWHLTSNFSGNADPISSNLSEFSGHNFLQLGSGMSVSSGVFTFPKTGVWLVEFNRETFLNGDDREVRNFIQCTTNNSSFTSRTENANHISRSESQNTHNQTYTMFIFDVENTSTHKVRFKATCNNSSTNTIGTANSARTWFKFTRLGDT